MENFEISKISVKLKITEMFKSWNILGIGGRNNYSKKIC